MTAAGVAGSNRNFAPQFTVPAGVRLIGYTLAGTSGTHYSTVEIACEIPLGSVGALRSLLAANGAKSDPLLFSGTARSVRNIRLRFATGKTPAEVTRLLAAIADIAFPSSPRSPRPATPATSRSARPSPPSSTGR
jgi:hypothetical protein